MLFNPRHLSRIKRAHASGNDGEFKSKSNNCLSCRVFFKLILGSLEVHVKILLFKCSQINSSFSSFLTSCFLNGNINEYFEMTAIVSVCAVVKSVFCCARLHSLNLSLCSLSPQRSLSPRSISPPASPEVRLPLFYLQALYSFWSNLNKNGRRASASLPLDKSEARISRVVLTM